MHRLDPMGAGATWPAEAPVPDIDWVCAALQEAPFSVSIADATLPDCPLVFVNRAFERTTGYRSADAVGRNCRFLQGPGTSPEAVRAIGTAIAEGKPIRVELLNYRHDREPFLNRLTLRPIRNANGALVAFVGYQYPTLGSWMLDEG